MLSFFLLLKEKKMKIISKGKWQNSNSTPRMLSNFIY